MSDNNQSSFDVTSWAQAMLAGARDNFNEDGYVNPIALIVVSLDPRTLAPLPAPDMLAVVPERFDSPSDKQTFAEAVKEAARRFKAIAVINLSEAWVVVHKTPTATPEEREKAIREAHRRWGKSLATHPERVEKIVAVFERPGAQPEMWYSDIQRPEGATATCTPFTRAEAVIEGLFVGLLAEWN